MKILVAITNYGTANDRYLDKVIAEYRSMLHHVDIVILSDRTKELAPEIRVIARMPTEDPWSLPFAHKKVLAEGLSDYDLFIYSEDDILITQKNIDAFLYATSNLEEDEIAGFLRTEVGPDGEMFYPDVNRSFHWDPRSVVERGGRLFAFFTCEHAACYVLTRGQLRRTLDSGTYLVEPHQGKYDLACTASTDPYTQAGLKKLVCISDLRDFLVPHLSNKYVGTDYDLGQADFERQIAAMHEIHAGRRSSLQLLRPETPFPMLKWGKDYYESPLADILAFVPSDAKNVLSVGCGWGAMEHELIKKGIAVTSIPLDSVISACAEARGVRACTPDFGTAWKELEGLRFDCIVVSNILHLVPEPETIVRRCSRLLSQYGCIILSSPNFDYAKVLWQKIRRGPGFETFGAMQREGFRLTSYRTVLEWLKNSGLDPTHVLSVFPKRARRFSSLLRPAAWCLASELTAVGQNRLLSPQLDARDRNASDVEVAVRS